MFCSNCGIKLPDDANFCYKCGVSVKEIKGSVGEAQWEYCQIYREWEDKCNVFRVKYIFWFHADVISPTQGKYQAKKSLSFESNDLYKFEKNGLAGKILDEFASGLVKDGWQPLPERGENWWHLCFRRQIK